MGAEDEEGKILTTVLSFSRASASLPSAMSSWAFWNAVSPGSTSGISAALTLSANSTSGCALVTTAGLGTIFSNTPPIGFNTPLIGLTAM